MNTAYVSIPTGGCLPTGYLLYTHPSGMYSNILGIQISEHTVNPAVVSLMEVYPIGTIPDMSNVTSGTILTTLSDEDVSSIKIKTSSNLGSEVRVTSSGEMEVFVNYQLIDIPLHRWDGYNQGLENGKLY